MRDPEYDRFGPWVIEITEEDPPPPLYLPYLNRIDESIFSIKIPRKIERRKAHPGMNLYDYMVMLYEEDIEILERVDDEVRAHAFPYADIQFIRVSEELLKGTLHLRLINNAFDLPFNTVSQNIMRHFVSLIRQRYTGSKNGGARVEEGFYKKEELSFYFSGLLADQKARNPEIRVLLSQPDRAVGSFETSPIRSIFFGVFEKKLLESLHMSDGRELTIIDRGKKYKYKWQTIYGTRTYTVPVARITGAEWEMDGKNVAITCLRIKTAGGSIRQVLMQGNPAVDTYGRFLLEH
jgi:hypothetical protein